MSLTGAEATAEAEVLVRHRRQNAVAREERQSREVERRKRDEAAVKRARVELPIALKLDTLGKTRGALSFYRQIVRIAPDSHGRPAGGRPDRRNHGRRRIALIEAGIVH